ncbi:hypothetical protein C2S51_034940 [Perilla frutescens var. frutescens]|nr:hypothetical protein C2S51_034940 [Perilla frutescens var. frutescens]
MSSKHLLDVDRFGYLDLEDEVEKLGYDSWDGLWYKVPNTSNYKLINDDKEVMEMTSYVFKGSNSFHIFVENGMVRGDKDENIQEKHNEIFSENSSEDDDYNPIGESETDDGLSDDELVSDDEEYLEARQNKKNSPLEFLDRRVAEIICLPSYVQGDEEIGGFQSDYEDSNDEVNSNSSGSELSLDNTTGVRQKRRKVTYDPKCDYKSLKLVLGMRFLDSYQCKHAIQTISLVHGYPIHFTRSNKRQCEAKCIPECGWKCYRSVVKKDQSFIIKTLSSDGHKCPRAMDNKQATASWLASEYLETIRDNPNIRIKELHVDMMRNYACQVSKWRLYRAKKQALEMIRGSLSDHYAWVRSFMAELMKVDSEGRYEIQGLINVMAELAPYAEHRNCARHVYCNWKKTYKGPTLKNIFWKVVRATYIESFNSALEDMRAENKAAYLNFLEREPQKFCKAFVSTIPACDMIDNNVSETFNGFIIEASGKHLIDMLQDIGRQLMKRQYVKFTAIGGFTDKVCPNIRAKIEQLKYEIRLCIVTPALNDKYEIQSGDDQFIVNM